MKKIGLLNCYNIKNYGSVLQSYALEKYINAMYPNKVESIRYYKKNSIYVILQYFPQIFIKNVILMKIKNLKKKLYLKFINRELSGFCEIRDCKFEKFVKDNCIVSAPIYGKKQLNEKVNDYSAIVLCSDQVWHPINLGNHYFTLEWVPDNVSKIIYAASFGVSQIPPIQYNATKKYLSRLTNISVREESAVRIVKDLVNKDAIVVADPTFLLDVNEWHHIMKETKEKEKYIFCYFLGNNSYARDFARMLSNEKGLRIVTIPFMDEIIKEDFEFGDVRLYDIGPAEFLKYIDNAEYVVTDSFHGTVFSSLFHKKYIVFNRYSSKDKGSTNSRIDTLLRNIGMENKCIKDDMKYTDVIDILNEEIDYIKLDEKIGLLREKSRCYLNEQLAKISDV